MSILTDALAEKLMAGDHRSLARLITMLERDDDVISQVMERVHSSLGRAYSVGVTGPPGAGKSTLVDSLTYLARQDGKQVGILAVDPTSPLTGGAVLGDRIRMQRHYLDDRVFIRSLATRGVSGGLSKIARGAVKLLDAAGTDTIVVETVGVGQTELDVMQVVDTVVVVLVPESGDAIQAMKAGLLEVADIFVINKADRPGAKARATELRTMLNIAETRPWWRPPVLLTQAHNGEGMTELHNAIQEHRQAQEATSRLEEKRRERRRLEFLETLEEGFKTRVHEMLSRETEVAVLLQQVQEGRVDAQAGALHVLRNGALMRNWLAQLEHMETPSDS